jgi:hypothetical protein
MAMSQFRKVTVSVPPSLVGDLDYLSARLGVSRSALVSQFLTEPVADLVAALRDIPANPGPADEVRFRGRSEAVIRERLERAQRLTDDMFSGGADR